MGSEMCIRDSCEYMQHTNKKALTEEVVIGTALHSYNRSICYGGVSCFSIQCFRKYVSTFITERSCVRGKKVVVFLDPQGQKLLDQYLQDETRWMYFDMLLLMHWTTKVSMENDYRMGLELERKTGNVGSCSILEHPLNFSPLPMSKTYWKNAWRTPSRF